jgi:hypothetical protein
VAADLTRRAVSAAVSVARAHGVELRTPCVLSDRSNVVVRLAPAPDEELIANDVRHGRVMVFAGYYDDEARASRLEPSIRRNARRFDGSVERHGTVTLLWVRGREGRLGERTRDCLL